MHFLPKKHCFWPKKALFLPKDLQKVRKSQQILIRDKIAYVRAQIFCPNPNFSAGATRAPVQLLPRCHTYMLILKKGMWIEMFTQRHRDIITIIKCAWLERNVWPFVCFSGMPRGKFLLLPYVSVIHSDICSIYLFGFKFFLVLVFEEFWRGDPTPPPFWRECGLCLF